MLTHHVLLHFGSASVANKLLNTFALTHSHIALNLSVTATRLPHGAICMQFYSSVRSSCSTFFGPCNCLLTVIVVVVDRSLHTPSHTLTHTYTYARIHTNIRSLNSLKTNSQMANLTRQMFWERGVVECSESEVVVECRERVRLWWSAGIVGEGSGAELHDDRRRHWQIALSSQIVNQFYRCCCCCCCHCHFAARFRLISFRI